LFLAKVFFFLNGWERVYREDLLGLLLLSTESKIKIKRRWQIFPFFSLSEHARVCVCVCLLKCWTVEARRCTCLLCVRLAALTRLGLHWIKEKKKGKKSLRTWSRYCLSTAHVQQSPSLLYCASIRAEKPAHHLSFFLLFSYIFYWIIFFPFLFILKKKKKMKRKIQPPFVFLCVYTILCDCALLFMGL
jgi:hypothetical protein